MRIDAITKSVNLQNIDIVHEVTPAKNLKRSEKSCDVKDDEEKSQVNIDDGVDEELSDNSIVQEDERVEDVVISDNEKCLEKESADDLERDISGLTFRDNFLAVNGNSNIVTPPENLVSSTSEVNNHSDVHSFNEVPIDKKDNEINQCHKALDSESVDTQPENENISIDDKDQPNEKKITEEIELIINGNEIEVSYSDETDNKISDIEGPSNKVEVNRDTSNEIPEIKGDNLTNNTTKELEENGEKEHLELNDEEVLKIGLNSEKNLEEASNSDKMDVLNDSQAAAMVTSTDEKELTAATILKQNYFGKEPSNVSENEESVTASGSSIERVINIDSDLISSGELVLNSNSKEAENTTSILKPNVAGELVTEKKLDNEEPENTSINSKEIEDSLILSVSHSEDEQVGSNTTNVPLSVEEERNKSNFENDDMKQNIGYKSSIIDDVKKTNLENNISSIEISEESHEVQEILETHEVQEIHKAQENHETNEAQETSEAIETNEVQETNETQKTPETLENHGATETHEAQESPIYIESDDSKSDCTEETEDNSILTTEDSKDGLDDSLKFSSLETLSMPSVDSPPEYNE